ncbi:MAG: efflux RND transporter periplasmic adaptor subunit, partial [Deltaproteobacteria bacterium]|nr:efflux RND transporter periplasmic adaptor subunit [Deltaproteobacteria bacterium]
MKKHFRHLTLFILYISLPALLTSCGSEKQAYVLQKVTIGTIRATCTATGTVNPLKTVLVGTQVSGKIKELHVDYNSPVTAGQLIAEIDPATFEAQLQQASANLISAQASLTKARASFTEAQRNLKRIHQLFAGGIIGQSDLDTAETNHAIAQSQVGVAGAQVVQTEATFNLAETNVKLTKIYSPVNGIVISRNVDIGQTVAASFQTPTLFSIAEDLRKMQINTNVDEADIGKIAVGQPAEFKVDAYPERLFAGRVQQIRNAPQVVQNVVTYDVVISADN